MKKQNDLPQSDPLYHDTWTLLRKYRDVVWSLELSVRRAQHKFQVEYGKSIEDFLDSVYVAGADLSGTDIEERAKCIERSHKMLNLVDDAAATMRHNHKNGELYYQVLYFNYFSAQEYHSQDAVLEALEQAGYPMCRKTMIEYRNHAVNLVSSFLWGYTARDTKDILDRFVKE